MAKRGPKPKPFLDRLLPKIDIPNIRSLIGTPPETWPTGKWPWIGAKASPINRPGLVRPAIPCFHVVRGRRVVVHALVWEVFMGRRPKAMRWHLKGTPDYCDVNPLHWNEHAPIPFVGEAQPVYQADAEADLADLLIQNYEIDPATMFFEVEPHFTDKQIRAALTRSGLDRKGVTWTRPHSTA